MSEDLNQADVVGAEPRRDPEILMESGSISLAGHDNGDACGECSVSRGMHAISADGKRSDGSPQSCSTAEASPEPS